MSTDLKEFRSPSTFPETGKDIALQRVQMCKGPETEWYSAKWGTPSFCFPPPCTLLQPHLFSDIPGMFLLQGLCKGLSLAWNALPSGINLVPWLHSGLGSVVTFFIEPYPLYLKGQSSPSMPSIALTTS